MMDETRPLFISQLISLSIGMAWLVLVYATPAPPPSISLVRPEEAASVEVEFENEKPKPAPEPTPTVPEPDPSAAAARKAEAKASKEAKDAGDAFGGGASSAMVGDVTNALRGVEVSKGGGGVGSGGGAGGGAGGGKAVIAYGQGGVGARTPGRGIDPSVAAAGANIGTVNANGSVARATIAVAAPTVVRAADGGSSGRDMVKLGTFVRGRQAQLQYCYRDVGLPINANLAGSLSVAITIDASGAVSDAKVATRSWSGAAVAETEACVLQRVRGWEFPPSAKSGAETYAFSFLFSR